MFFFIINFSLYNTFQNEVVVNVLTICFYLHPFLLQCSKCIASDYITSVARIKQKQCNRKVTQNLILEDLNKGTSSSLRLICKVPIVSIAFYSTFFYTSIALA